MTTTVAIPPEQGQLVSCRSRQWIVTDVRPSTLPAPAPKPTFSGPQNLLTLASVEDDGLGEELHCESRCLATSYNVFGDWSQVSPFQGEEIKMLFALAIKKT